MKNRDASFAQFPHKFRGLKTTYPLRIWILRSSPILLMKTESFADSLNPESLWLYNKIKQVGVSKWNQSVIDSITGFQPEKVLCLDVISCRLTVAAFAASFQQSL